MTDIVERLRDSAALPTGLYAEAADEIERLRAEVQHWKSNHDNRVEAARLLIERRDLPFDRIYAYKHYLKLQEEVQHYRIENEEQARLLGMSAERELSLRSEVEAMRNVVDAAENLVKVRGHHHVGPAYERLTLAVDATMKKGETQ